MRQLLDDLQGAQDESTSIFVFADDEQQLEHLTSFLSYSKHALTISLHSDVSISGQLSPTSLTRLYNQALTSDNVRRVMVVTGADTVTAGNVSTLDVLMRLMEAKGSSIRTPEGPVSLAGVLLFAPVSMRRMEFPSGHGVSDTGDVESLRRELEAKWMRLAQEYMSHEARDGTRSLSIAALMGRIRHLLPLRPDPQGGWRVRAGEGEGGVPGCSIPRRQWVRKGAKGLVDVAAAVVTAMLLLFCCVWHASNDSPTATQPGQREGQAGSTGTAHSKAAAFQMAPPAGGRHPTSTSNKQSAPAADKTAGTDDQEKGKDTQTAHGDPVLHPDTAKAARKRRGSSTSAAARR